MKRFLKGFLKSFRVLKSFPSFKKICFFCNLNSFLNNFLRISLKRFHENSSKRTFFIFSFQESPKELSWKFFLKKRFCNLSLRSFHGNLKSKFLFQNKLSKINLKSLLKRFYKNFQTFFLFFQICVVFSTILLESLEINFSFFQFEEFQSKLFKKLFKFKKQKTKINEFL